jgi:hypothetical protein
MLSHIPLIAPAGKAVGRFIPCFSCEDQKMADPLEVVAARIARIALVEVKAPPG